MTENQHLPRSIPPTKTKLGPLALFAGLCAFSQAVAAGADTEALAAAAKAASALPLVQPRQPDGKGKVAISGELKQWHKVTLSLDGPFAHEQDDEPNPFTDLAFNVTFTHESGSPKYVVPGYFAADGDAANSSADSGTKWRAHLSPDKAGKWNYAVSFTKGKVAALDGKGEALKPFDGVSGSFEVGAADKTGRDFRGKGRLQYVGTHYLQFAGSKEYFLKAGADAPETLLAYRISTAPSAARARCSGPARRNQRRRSRRGSRICRTGNPATRRGRTARARA